MKQFLFLLLFVCSSFYLSSVECYMGGATTQSELDIFIDIYKNCDTLTGSFQLIFEYKINKDPIVDLSPLKNINTILGNVLISGKPVLGTLNGLYNLKTVKGNLEIESYIAKDLTGLESLEVVEGNLSIVLSEIVTLKGLENLKILGNGFGLYRNDSLKDISILNKNLKITNDSFLFLIKDNKNLSVCNNQFICSLTDKYEKPSNSFVIEHNNEGCNSIEEVKKSCLQSSVTVGNSFDGNLKFKTNNLIEFDYSLFNKNIIIYDLLGVNYSDMLFVSDKFINLSNLRTGLYILVINNKHYKIIKN